VAKTPSKKSWFFLVVNGVLGGLMVGGMTLAVLASRRGDSEAVTFWTRVSLFSFGAFLLYALPRLAQSLFLAGTASLPFHIPLLGVIFGVLMVIVTLAAFTTGNNLFYLLLAVLSATLVVSMVANRLNLHRLAVDFRAPQHIFANEPAQLDIALTNQKRFLPVFSLLLTLERPQAEENVPQALASYAMVSPRVTAHQRVAHTFTRRGVYSLAGLTLRTRFPFGLMERRQRLGHTGELVVYPPLRPLGEFATAPFLQAGLHESLQRGQGGELYLIRPYHPTDRRRAIDWKATAKTAQLMTRELTREEDWQVTVAFDATTPAASAESFERAVNFTASVIDWLIAKGAAVRLLLTEIPANTPAYELDGLSRYGEGRAHGLALLGWLARVAMPAAQAADETVRLPEWMERLGHALQPAAWQNGAVPAESALAWLNELDDLHDGRASLFVVTPVPQSSLPAWLKATAQVFSFDQL
jgi:uncharacterized protein YhhL (DUF1145 family)